MTHITRVRLYIYIYIYLREEKKPNLQNDSNTSNLTDTKFPVSCLGKFLLRMYETHACGSKAYVSRAVVVPKRIFARNIQQLPLWYFARNSV